MSYQVYKAVEKESWKRAFCDFCDKSVKQNTKYAEMQGEPDGGTFSVGANATICASCATKLSKELNQK